VRGNGWRAAMFVSTRFASSGAWNEFDVREMRTSTLKSDSDNAIRRVRVPAMRTEYASVPMRWMTKVSAQMTSNPESIRYSSA
jgi:hypothetical protein